MSKKIFFLCIFFITIVFSLQTVSAACGIWRYKSDVKNVKVNSSLSGDDAPVIAIGWSRDHTEDLSFYMQLVGAEWDYGNSGTIQRGVTYQKVDKKTLEIFVDVGTGSDEINFGGGYNIYVPIYCTVKDAGEIRVIVDGNETTVSSANIVVAKAVNGKLTVHGNKAEINKSGTLKKITVTDTSTQSYGANQKITMEIDTGFHFTGNVKITGTGKFANIVRFDVDQNTPSKAYITITQATPAQEGEIILEDMEVARNSEGKFNVVMIKSTFNASVVPLSSTLAVASYLKEETSTTTTTTTIATTTTEATTETTTEATTEASTSAVVIAIGTDSYSVNNAVFPLDAPAYITNGRTMLPLRAVANAMDISDENISYDTDTKTATLYLDADNYVSITVGENKIVSHNNGAVTDTTIATPAEVSSGRIFLPVRAVANALGIPDSNINYDTQSSTVTIFK
jgi:hypothetical protein